MNIFGIPVVPTLFAISFGCLVLLVTKRNFQKRYLFGVAQLVLSALVILIVLFLTRDFINHGFSDAPPKPEQGFSDSLWPVAIGMSFYLLVFTSLPFWIGYGILLWTETRKGKIAATK